MFIILVLMVLAFISAINLNLMTMKVENKPVNLTYYIDVKKTTDDTKTQLEQAFVSICEMVKAYSIQNLCNKSGWSFIQTNTALSLIDINNLPKSNTISCSNLESFARYKLFNCISHLNWSRYSVYINPPPLASDECGIVDFVFK